MKKIIYLIALTVAFTAFSGCAQQKKEQTNKLRLGIMPSVSVAPYLHALDTNAYKDSGIDVEIILFSSPQERDAALQANQVDAIITDLVAVALLNENGTSLSISHLTYDTFELSVNNSITSIEALNNQKVAISEKSAIEFFVDYICEKNNITVDKIPLPKVPDRKAALESNQVAAAIMPEPFPSIMIQQNTAHNIWSSKQDSLDITVLAYNTNYAKQNPETIKSFNQTTTKSIDYLNTHAQELKDKTGIYKEYRQLLIDYGILNEMVVDAVSVPAFHSLLDKPSKHNMDLIKEWLKTRHLVNDTFNFEDLMLEN